MYKRQLQQRVDGKYVSAGTKTVTLKKGEISVSDEGEGHKFVLETGKAVSYTHLYISPAPCRGGACPSRFPVLL